MNPMEEGTMELRTKGAALLSAAAIAGTLTGAAAQAQDKDFTIAVSIPAATHGWTGGVVYHAQEAEKQLEAAYPNIDVIVSMNPVRGSSAVRSPDPSALTYEVTSAPRCSLARTLTPGMWRLTARSCRGSTVIRTGSLRTLSPAAIVTLVAPPKRTCMLDPDNKAGPRRRCPT